MRSSTALGALPRRQHLHDRFEAAHAAAGTRRRRTDGAQTRAARQHHTADAGGGTHPPAGKGPNIAAMEFSGWDTHANQGTRRRRARPPPRAARRRTRHVRVRRWGRAWSNTTVVVMTEFGRTARPNGTRGTDHGTAGAGFLLGPQVSRSQVFADWPGLARARCLKGVT